MPVFCSLRGYEFRSLAHIVGDYYVAPRFLDAIAVRCIGRHSHAHVVHMPCSKLGNADTVGRWPQMHVVKNKLVDMGLLGTDLRVPLILGVWCVLLLSLWLIHVRMSLWPACRCIVCMHELSGMHCICMYKKDSILSVSFGLG